MKPKGMKSRLPNPSVRKWNTEDFYGKYHLTRIGTKHPIPGSQVKQELSRIDQKNTSDKLIQDRYDQRQTEIQEKLKVNKIGAELQSKIFVHLHAGYPIEKAESILNTKENLLTTPIIQKDPIESIQKFMKYIKLGKDDYIAYALEDGYQSINWQEPEFGNTALHIATRLGLTNIIKILLKYKANPDICNRLGNFPLHEAWTHWRTPIPDVEMKIQQENRTVEILQLLLSSGAYVDSMQLDGSSTALHIAARLGPLEAVKCILGYRANHEIQDKSGHTAHNIAIHHHRDDIAKILNSWIQIKHALIHLDFSLQWKRFMKDYKADATRAATAKQTMTNLTMRDNVHLLDLTARDGNFVIDDPLLQHAKHMAHMEENTGNEKMRNKDSLSLSLNRPANSNSNTPIDGNISRKLSDISLLSVDTFVSRDKIQSTSTTPHSRLKFKRMESALIAREEDTPGTGFSRPGTGTGTGIGTASASTAPRSSYADRRTYITTTTTSSSTTAPSTPFKVNINNGVGGGGGGGGDLSNNSGNKSKTVHFNAEDVGRDLASYLGTRVSTADGLHHGNNSSNSNSNSTGNGNNLPPLTVEVGDTADYSMVMSPFDGSPGIASYNDTFLQHQHGSPPDTASSHYDTNGTTDSRPTTSEMGLRRIAIAQRIALDGKFSHVTKRASTASAIMLARRTRDAPLLGTEEQDFVARILTTTIQDIDTTTEICRKEAARAAYFGTKVIRPATSAIGEYLPSKNSPEISDREKLYSRLNDRSLVMKTSPMLISSQKKSVDASRYENNIPLVNNRRRLFTEVDLLPPPKEITLLDQVKQRISESTPNHNGHNDSNKTPKNIVAEAKNLSEAIEEAYFKTRRIPPKEVVTYGRGRVQTIHIAKQALETPWSTVGANYSTHLRI